MFRFITTIINIIISTFAALLGSVGTSGQASEHQLSRSLIIKPSAKSGSGFPRFSGRDMPAMSIAAGGGGTGAKAPPSVGQDKQDTSKGESLLDKVGKMVEESREEDEGPSRGSRHADESTVLRERSEEEPPNPKKRMFEESRVSENQGERVRDEL